MLTLNNMCLFIIYMTNVILNYLIANKLNLLKKINKVHGQV